MRFTLRKIRYFVIEFYSYELVKVFWIKTYEILVSFEKVLKRERLESKLRIDLCKQILLIAIKTKLSICRQQIQPLCKKLCKASFHFIKTLFEFPVDCILFLNETKNISIYPWMARVHCIDIFDWNVVVEER